MLKSGNLSSFCIFELLGLQDDEGRHSRIVGWLLDPGGAHGFGDDFLKTWLVDVIREGTNQNISPVRAEAVESWQLRSVEILREWRYVDLLLVLTLEDGSRFPICIENKVNSIQGENQLSRYRERVTSAFPAAPNYLFIFLTKRLEQPADPAFMSASYRHVLGALSSCLDARSSVGIGPAVEFLQQYRRLLDRCFVNPPIRCGFTAASERVAALIHEHRSELGVECCPSNKMQIRFVPVAWLQPGNTHGTEWRGRGETILFELELGGSTPRLKVVSARAPEAWIGPLWERAGEPPFNRMEPRSENYPVIHMCEAAQVNCQLPDPDAAEPVAQVIFAWLREVYTAVETREVIDIVAARLPQLDAIIHRIPH